MGYLARTARAAYPVQTIGGNVNLTLKSRNKKTGDIPVSTSGRHTCPDACPFKQGPCYAMSGPLALFWDKVSQNQAGVSYDRFLDQVANLPDGQLWRHNQSGDLEPCKSDPETIDLPKLTALVQANKGRRGFTFSHFDPLNNIMNDYALGMANRNGFTVNLSGNDFDHADALADLDIGPVVTVAPIEYERRTEKNPSGKGKVWAETMPEYKARLASLPGTTPEGRRLVICPATYSDDVSCKTCGLCQKANRKTIVAFPAHGTSRRKADAIARKDLSNA